MARIAFLAVGLTASLAAQAYTNGPFQTAATGGGPAGTSAISVLQTQVPPAGLSHTVFGYGAQQAAGVQRNALVDNFQVNSFLQINSIELFGYTTGSAVTSCTGVYVAIWNVAPTPTTPNSANVLQATSPDPLSSPFATTNNRIAAATNTFTNIYRILDTGTPTTQTTRNVQSVVVSLGANPAILTPGQYWLEFCFNGLNFVPPITATNQGSTGDAQQFTNASLLYTPILNGTVDTAGMPFNFSGPFGTAGSINNIGGGCDTMTLRVVGAPAVGGFVRAELTGGTGLLTQIAVGFAPTATPLGPCGCIDRAGILAGAALLGSPLAIQIPRASASLAGAQLVFQGVDIGLFPPPEPCPLGPVTVGTSDAFTYTLNLN